MQKNKNNKNLQHDYYILEIYASGSKQFLQYRNIRWYGVWDDPVIKPTFRPFRGTRNLVSATSLHVSAPVL